MKHYNFGGVFITGKNLKYLLFVIFSFSILESYSQVPLSSGYIILNNQDTIFGRVENSYLGSLNKCIFVREGTSRIQFLKPEKVKEFMIYPDTYFQAKTVNEKETFLHLICRGKINLYQGDMNLYISCGSGNPSLLTGDKEYIEKDGKKYSVKNTSYKTRIKTCLADSSYYPEIDQLFFDKKHIIKLINEINGQSNLFPENKRKHKIDHQNQFSIDFSYSLYNLELENMNYTNDSVFSTYGKNVDLLSSGNVKNKLNAWGIGFSFKHNLKSTNLYFYTGFKYNKCNRCTTI